MVATSEFAEWVSSYFDYTSDGADFVLGVVEYTSTLEGDTAERDRMLDHFGTQLGSTESENLALTQGLPL